MGTVWRVQHVHTLQHFAIKTLHPGYALNELARRRFLREARLTAAIESPHVVRVIDLRIDHLHEGRALPFLVMDLVEGPSLEQVLSTRGRLTPCELLGVLQQVGEGLASAHARGIVHRDLKPSNIIISCGSRGSQLVKLCDFGIAKLRLAEKHDRQDGAPLSTDTGSIFGTPRYMAPEQLTRTGRVVPATDQWALALTAFRCLAGHDYFDDARNGVELVLAIVHETLSIPSRLSQAVTTRFDSWFLRSCARDPTARFPDVAAQIEALQAALGNAEPKPIDLQQPRAAGGAPLADLVRSRQFERELRLSDSHRRERLLYVLAVTAGMFAILATNWVSGRFRSMLPLAEDAAPRGGPMYTPGSVPSASSNASQHSNAAHAPPPYAPSHEEGTKMSGAKQKETHAPIDRAAVSKPQLHLPQRNNQGQRVARLRPLGATCARTTECEKGVCLAEICQ